MFPDPHHKGPIIRRYLVPASTIATTAETPARRDPGDAFHGPTPPAIPPFRTARGIPSLQRDGVVYQASQVTSGDISDGLSNTFLAGEKWLGPQFYYASSQAGDDNSMMQGFDHDVIRWCGTVILRFLTHQRGLYDEWHYWMVCPRRRLVRQRACCRGQLRLLRRQRAAHRLPNQLDHLHQPGLPQLCRGEQHQHSTRSY